MSWDVIGTFLTVALFAAFILVAAAIGVLAGWLLFAAIVIWVIGVIVAAIMGLTSLFSRPRRVHCPDCYAEPIGDYPKVPHG